MRHGGDSEQQRDELSRYPFPPPIRRLDWPGPSDLCVCAVWRYLQEAGFGNAALQLSRCWIRDPDTLPFAKNIEPHTLIRLVQDGMCFDQLQAEACNVRRIHALQRAVLTAADGAAIQVRHRPRTTIFGAQWQPLDPRQGHTRPPTRCRSQRRRPGTPTKEDAQAQEDEAHQRRRAAPRAPGQRRCHGHRAQRRRTCHKQHEGRVGAHGLGSRVALAC